MTTTPNTSNAPITPTPSILLRGLLTEAELPPPRDGYPEGARAAIVCGSCVVELYGAAIRALVGTEPGTLVQVLADVLADRVRVEGRERPQTRYRFRARSAGFVRES